MQFSEALISITLTNTRYRDITTIMSPNTKISPQHFSPVSDAALLKLSRIDDENS
jgi:hypothetical protein